MARPPAISMHRARGASVPSRRRRIRRPGRARRAAARQPGPRCPRARPPGGAHCARLAPPGRPWAAPSLRAALSAPDGPALQVGARDCLPPGKHVNLEKVAGRAGPDLRGRAWAPPARALSFSSRTKVPRGASRGRGDRVLPAAPRRGPVVPYGQVGVRRGGVARRGTGGVGPGRALRPAVSVPEPSRPAKSCGRWHRAALCGLHAWRREAFGTRTQTRGPGSVPCGHESAALAASGRVPPPRAGQSTCVSRVTIGFRATPEGGKCISHFRCLVSI